MTSCCQCGQAKRRTKNPKHTTDEFSRTNVDDLNNQALQAELYHLNLASNPKTSKKKRRKPMNDEEETKQRASESCMNSGRSSATEEWKSRTEE